MTSTEDDEASGATSVASVSIKMSNVLMRLPQLNSHRSSSSDCQLQQLPLASLPICHFAFFAPHLFFCKYLLIFLWNPLNFESFCLLGDCEMNEQGFRVEIWLQLLVQAYYVFTRLL